MNLQDAQQDMKNGYGYGSVGVIVSGIVWLISSLAVNFYSSKNGIWTLMIGECLFFQSQIYGKLIGQGGHYKNNPLAKLTMENNMDDHVYSFSLWFVSYESRMVFPSEC